MMETYSHKSVALIVVFMIGRVMLAIGKVFLVISQGYGLDRLGAVGARSAADSIGHMPVPIA